MSVVVKKFGGTSVANIERIEFVAEKIFQFYQKNKQMVIIVSAMKGETDSLENLAYKISPDPDLREMAALLATGEQVVISLLAMALIKRGCPARSYTGIQLGIETTGIVTKSRINKINLNKIQEDLKDETIVIVAGFQGGDSNTGNITTLGRGGSDTTAVALSVALNAKICEIYTDVDGVYTADPRIVPTAKKLNMISFHEMLELSGLGAKVMQIQAVELGSYYAMPIKVLSSFHLEEQLGTVICNDETSNNIIDLVEKHAVKFAVLKGQIKVVLENLDDVKIRIILANLADLEINVDFFNQAKIGSDTFTISFVISVKELEQFKVLWHKINLADVTLSYSNIAKLSIVGLCCAANSRVLSDIYSTLTLAQIALYHIITSEIKVSMLIDEKDVETALNILHTRLVSKSEFARTTICSANIDIAQ